MCHLLVGLPFNSRVTRIKNLGETNERCTAHGTETRLQPSAERREKTLKERKIHAETCCSGSRAERGEKSLHNLYGSLKEKRMSIDGLDQDVRSK